MADDDLTIVRPQDLTVPTAAIDVLPRQIAERYRVCPVNLVESRGGGRTLTVAVADPNNLLLHDQLQQVTGCRITFVRAKEEDILRGIDHHYAAYAEKPSDMLSSMDLRTPGSVEETMPASAPSRGGAPTVENILQRAILDRATDIHIEPYPDIVYIRYRVDGLLYDHATYDPSAHAQIISRIKILAKMDIGQTRLPQDGRLPLKLGNREFDVRVSVVPSIGGEAAVLRLLPKGALALDFTQLGLIGRNRQIVEDLIARPFGLLLATGPTGSGKTTTLYAALDKIDCVARSVITIEDPVEYQFARITQMQVHPKIGFTFATGLRSILRQDPDIVMVGEIRDLETLQMAIQASLTGHLVFSTLHCNDAAAGATRMIDMGAEPFLVASSVSGFIAQRLLRKLCEDCKQPWQPDDLVRERLPLPEKGTFFSPKGCDKCRGTGYRGRVGVFEVVPVGGAVQAAIVRKATTTEIRALIRDAGYPSLQDDGIAKVAAGLTTPEEVLRAVYVDAL
jgi:type II secretory ATPase GspE/PulE/Tfp pilus assembly ATPase PilB-like protein